MSELAVDAYGTVIEFADRVVDTEQSPPNQTRAVVVNVCSESAAEFTIADGVTVADVNKDVYEDDRIVEVVFIPEDGQLMNDPKRYAYPETRLKWVSDDGELTGAESKAGGERNGHS